MSIAFHNWHQDLVDAGLADKIWNEEVELARKRWEKDKKEREDIHINHDIKCWPEFFDEILADRRRAELRRNDRNYALGDTLTIREFYPDSRGYTGRVVMRLITDMTTANSEFGKQAQLHPEWVVMSIAPVTRANGEPLER